ncbi:MAG: hypothetical protein PHD54_10955 [Desulfuromonadaceae bacterium]|nr:hypothetical protein [Desulfuromonadaceae bacterium]
MKYRHLLVMAVLCMGMNLVSPSSGRAEPAGPSSFKSGLAPSLLPSVEPYSNTDFDLKNQSLPRPKNTPELPWVLQFAGSLVFYSAEQYAKGLYDDGRPPLPNKEYPNYFYPSPHVNQHKLEESRGYQAGD